MAIVINNWDEFFENSQSKRWDNIRWVPIPNKQGLGYKKIMQQKNGAEIFGCWIAIIECASRQNPRGIINMSINDLALETMINVAILTKSIDYLQTALMWLIVHSEQNQSIPTPQYTSPLNQRSILFNSIPCNSSSLKEDVLTWRNSFDIYKQIVDDTYQQILNDQSIMDELQRLNPNLDIKLSLEKSVVNFWGTDAGWKHKKKSRSTDIDMLRTLKANIDRNKVYLQKENQSRYGPQKVTNDELDEWAKTMRETLKD